MLLIAFLALTLIVANRAALLASVGRTLSRIGDRVETLLAQVCGEPRGSVRRGAVAFVA